MRYVRFAAFAAVAVVGLGSAAFAADLPVKAPVHQASPSMPYNWSGFYIGVNLGGISEKTDGFLTNFPARSWHTHERAGLGGIHGGYQYQFGQVVVGVEGGWSFQLGNAFGSEDGGGESAPCGIDDPRSCQARIAYILQIGPRLGWAVDRWMLYGTGGYARAKVNTRTFDPTSEFTFTSADSHHNGWFAGGGLEYLLTTNLVLGVDYKHYDFGSKAERDSVFADFDRTYKASADAVTARLTIKMGG
jgi:outer membrane immunogenic protein